MSSSTAWPNKRFYFWPLKNYTASREINMPEPETDNGLDSRFDYVNPCGYCRAANSVKLYQASSISGDKFGINRCLNCHAVFLSPRPSEEQLQLAYGDCYYGSGQKKFSGLIEKVLDYFRFSRARRLMSYVSPPAKILDVGCGNGRFFDGYGIELPGKAAERAGRIPELNLKTGQISEDDFDKSFFDAVTMWHVFEHLPEPQKTLSIISRILKPGGFLFISMPNIDSIQSKLFKGNWLHLDPPKHLFFFAPDQLVAKLNNFGFRLIRQNHFSMEQNPFGMQQSILNCLMSKREVLFECLKGNKVYVQEYSSCSITMQKLFYISTFGIFTLLAAMEALLKRGGTMELIFTKEQM